MGYGNKTEEIRLRYYGRIQDEIAGNRDEVQLIMERSFSSVCMVLERVESIPLSDFIIRTAVFTQNFKPSKYSSLYTGQINLAKCNPEQFAFGLHDFYEKLSAKVRKNKEFQEIAEFLGAVMRSHFELRALVGNDVADAYINLILQTMEYLRPKKYDMESCLYGVSTAGEPLAGPYPLPYSDVPGIELQREFAQGKRFTSRDELLMDAQKRYAKYGVTIRNLNDLDRLEQIQRTHINTVVTLLPFINEYTWDMAPIIPYTSRVAPFASMTFSPIDLNLIRTTLYLIRMPLPEEGVEILFDDPDKFIQKLIMKEVRHNDDPYILYRLSTQGGVLYGYYDIYGELLYSILRETQSPLPYANFTVLFLVLYAFLALPNPRLPELNTIFKQHGQPLLIEIPGFHELHGR